MARQATFYPGSRGWFGHPHGHHEAALKGQQEARRFQPGDRLLPEDFLDCQHRFRSDHNGGHYCKEPEHFQQSGYHPGCPSYGCGVKIKGCLATKLVEADHERCFREFHKQQERHRASGKTEIIRIDEEDYD